MFSCLKQAFHRQSSSSGAATVEPNTRPLEANTRPLEPNTRPCPRPMSHRSNTTFPPPGYRHTPVNALLANALELTAPASDILLKNRKNSWIQLAGHAGSFAPAGTNTIWKKQTDGCESKCYEELMKDSLKTAVPKYYRQVEYNDDIFIELEDLLQHFSDPCIMDIKMGSRTFLESEVTNQKLRPDLYEKLFKLDPNEPTAEEHEQCAITKLRYMQYRERGSSTATLGFRVDALRIFGEPPCKDLKKVRTRDEVTVTLLKFIGRRPVVCQRLLQQLQRVRKLFEQSKYFRHHDVIGSSLLLLYDRDDKTGVWMIDFAKTTFVNDKVLTHRDPWRLGNCEDGFLTGLDSLIEIMNDVCHQQSQDSNNINSTESNNKTVSRNLLTASYSKGSSRNNTTGNGGKAT